MIRAVASSLFACCILAACQSNPATLTDQQRAELAAEVDAAATEWWAAWEAVDLERGMSYVSESSQASWVDDERIIYGAGEMRTEWTSWASELRSQEVQFTDSRTLVLAPDLAYTIRDYTVTPTWASGETTGQLTGVETLLWVKEVGGWKVLTGHESTRTGSWQARLAMQSDPS